MPRPKNTPLSNSKALRNRPPPLKTRGVFANVKLESIPFDTAVDCPPYACFNCRVLDEHLSKDCKKSVRYEFCANCGRRGVDVRKCPRCSKGYIEQYGPKSLKHIDIEHPVAQIPKNMGRKLPVGMTPPPKPTNKKQSTTLGSPAFQISYDKTCQLSEQICSSTSNSAGSSEIYDEYCSHDDDDDDDEDLDEIVIDEDLDDMVIGEDEFKALESQTSETVQSFMSLKEIIKHLPIETQSKIFIQFVEEQKVLAEQN